MKLMQMLNKFNKLSQKDNKEEFDKFVWSLSDEEIENLQSFGEILVELSKTVLNKRKQEEHEQDKEDGDKGEQT